MLSKPKRLRRLPLVGTSPPAVVRFKHDNRSTGLSVPLGAKERVPDAGKNEDGKAEADDQQRKHRRAGFGLTRLCGGFDNPAAYREVVGSAVKRSFFANPARIRWRSLQCDITSKCLEFRDHDTNTQAPPNEQAGTLVSEQPFAAPPIDSMLNQQGNF